MDSGCLAEVFAHLTDANLCRARGVCTLWRDAASMPGTWRRCYERMHGEHSARWAAAHEPLDDKCATGEEWRLRCAR